MKKTIILIAMFVSVMAFAGNNPTKFGLQTEEISKLETSNSINTSLMNSYYTDASDGLGYSSLTLDNADIYLWSETAPCSAEFIPSYTEVNLTYKGTTYTDVHNCGPNMVAQIQIFDTGFNGEWISASATHHWIYAGVDYYGATSVSGQIIY